MIIPVRPEQTKSFAIVEREVSGASPRERFEKRAAEIALAAEIHTRRMLEDESALLSDGPVPSGIRACDPETRDTVPFGLQRRIVLRVPVFHRDASAKDEELRKIRGLMAQIALDLIAQVLEINRYFAEAGLVRSPEIGADFGSSLSDAPAGKTMSAGSEGSSFRRRA